MLDARENRRILIGPDVHSGGATGAIIQLKDWSDTPLGDPAGWSASLRSLLSMLLVSKFPMFLAWGPKLTFLYNDAYAPILGARHPDALGRPFQEIWPEIWPDLEHLVDKALGGEASWLEDMPLLMYRNGYDEPTWFTFSYSPARDDDGVIKGVFCACTETTEKVLAVRENIAERERLEQLFANAPVFMALLEGPEHRFRLTNAAYLQLVGHREVIGRTAREAFPDLEGQGFFELLDAVYRTGDPFIGQELPLAVQPSPESPSRLAFINFVYQPTRDSAGRITGVFASGYEVSELKQARDRLRLAQQAGNIGAFELYPSSRTLAVTEEFCRIWGVEFKPVLSLDQTLRAIHPDDISQVLTAQRQISEQSLGQVEYRIIRPDNSDERWIARRGEAIRDADQDVVRFAGVIYDITDQKRAELALIATQARQAFLLDLGDRLRNFSDPVEVMRVAAAAVGDHLKVGRVGYGEIDAAQTRMSVEQDWTDGTMASLSGERRDLDCFGPSVMARLRAGDTLRIDDVLADPAAAPYAAGYASIGSAALLIVPLIKSGRFEAVFYLHSAQPRIWTDEEAVLAEEVAERTWASVEKARAEFRLRELNQLLETEVTQRTRERDQMWRLSKDLFLLIGPRGVIEAANPAVAVLGYHPAQLVGQRIAHFAHPTDLVELADALRAALKKPVANVETRLRSADGSWLWFSWSAAPGEGLVHAIGRNITAEKARLAELEQVQEALRQAQKLEAMGQLTGGVAHDFNNLLTPIVGSLDLLHRRGVGGEREQRLIDGALQSADRAKTLVQRLLAFARRQPLQATAVDLRALVRGMAELIASTSGPRIKLHLDLPDDIPAVMADPNQLEMAILNLAVNSRDAMPDGGQLSISAVPEALGTPSADGLRPGNYVRLNVADTGAGMDETTVKRAIEPFFSTKGIGRGTGLGLSMVHGLASQLGGILKIDSKPGLGTSISLWLPQATETPLPRLFEAEAPLVTTGRVLLVDDEEVVRATTADMLAELGFDVAEESSAEAALQRLDGGYIPDLILTDHLMPGMTGADLAQVVRLRHPTIRVLIISGYAEDQGLAPELPRLTKPFKQVDLAAAIAELRVGAETGKRVSG